MTGAGFAADGSAVASELFGFQQGSVGPGDDFREGLTAVGGGESDADGELGNAAGAERGREVGADPFGDDAGVRHGAVGEDRDEFLAAVAGGDVAGSDAVAQHAREQSQGAVAGLVAVEVVEVLEVVEVGERDDELSIVGEQLVGAVFEGAPVGEAGEGVGLGLRFGAGQDAEDTDPVAGLAGDKLELGREVDVGWRVDRALGVQDPGGAPGDADGDAARPDSLGMVSKVRAGVEVAAVREESGLAAARGGTLARRGDSAGADAVVDCGEDLVEVGLAVVGDEELDEL